MNLLTSIAFTLDRAALLTQARLDPASADAAGLLALADLTERVAQPKAAYAVAFIEARAGDTVHISGETFMSRTLSRNLQSTERVFAHVATCGHEMDEAFSATDDPLKEFWWDVIKGHVLATATHLSDHLHRRFRLGKTAVMRPGSGDVSVWPIEQPRALLAVISPSACA